MPTMTKAAARNAASGAATEMARFQAWLVERGAVLEPLTSEWELLRVRSIEGLHVAYRNKAGKETWPAALMEMREAFREGRLIPLSPNDRPRRKLRGRVQTIADRDGLWCWFCQIGFLNVDSREITIEHLVPRAHDGPDHISNLVLACEPCNKEAGNRSAAEKVALRDRKLGRAA